jgi:hypothetical protein
MIYIAHIYAHLLIIYTLISPRALILEHNNWSVEKTPKKCKKMVRPAIQGRPPTIHQDLRTCVTRRTSRGPKRQRSGSGEKGVPFSQKKARKTKLIFCLFFTLTLFFHTLLLFFAHFCSFFGVFSVFFVLLCIFYVLTPCIYTSYIYICIYMWYISHRIIYIPFKWHRKHIFQGISPVFQSPRSIFFLNFQTTMW